MRKFITAGVVAAIMLIAVPTLALWTSTTTAQHGYARYGAWAATSDTTLLMGNTGGTNTYAGLFYMTIGVGITSTEAFQQMPVPIAGTIGTLRAAVTVTPASGKSRVFTVRKNGAATAVTCTINPGATTCADTTHTASFAAGDLFTLEQNGINTPTSSVLMYGVVFTAS